MISPTADSAQIQAGIADTQRHTGLAEAHTQFYAAHGAFGFEELPDAPDLPDFLKPGESYLAPTSGFFFGQSSQSPSFISLLPAEEFGHRLIQRYFDAVHPIARCVHRPSFEGMYNSFWDDVRQAIEPRPSIQAVVFAAWFSAAVGVEEGFGRDQECDKAQLVLHLKIGTETALSKANFLSTTRFETLQAFIMYLVSIVTARAFLRKADSMISCPFAVTKYPEHTRFLSAPPFGLPSAWACIAMARPTA